MLHIGTDGRKILIVCVYVVGLGIGALLLIQHWVHIPQFLPYLVFLACPLMHLFMHRGHGGHGHGDRQIGKTDNDS